MIGKPELLRGLDNMAGKSPEELGIDATAATEIAMTRARFHVAQANAQIQQGEDSGDVLGELAIALGTEGMGCGLNILRHDERKR